MSPVSKYAFLAVMVACLHFSYGANHECLKNTTLCTSPKFCFDTDDSYECRCLGNRMGDNCVEVPHVMAGRVEIDENLSIATDGHIAGIKNDIATALQAKLKATVSGELFVEVVRLATLTDTSRTSNPEALFIVRSERSLGWGEATSPSATAAYTKTIPGCGVGCDLNGVRTTTEPKITLPFDICSLEAVNTCDTSTSVCSNSRNIVFCQCLEGFQESEDPDVCKDIDECSTGVHECPTGSTCQNLAGSYTCACPDEKVYNATDKACKSDPCVESSCPENFECRALDGNRSFQCVHNTEKNRDFNDDDDDGWKHATIAVSCVLGALCVILIAVVIFLTSRKS